VAKREEIVYNWRKLRNKELHNVTTPDLFRCQSKEKEVDEGRKSEGKWPLEMLGLVVEIILNWMLYEE
jgi:hypothetical protein